MNEYPEGVIVADVLDGCGDNLQVTYSDNWKRIINGDLAGGKNGTCKVNIDQGMPDKNDEKYPVLWAYPLAVPSFLSKGLRMPIRDLLLT